MLTGVCGMVFNTYMTATQNLTNTPAARTLTEDQQAIATLLAWWNIVTVMAGGVIR